MPANPLTSSHTISVHAGPSCSISTTPFLPAAAAAATRFFAPPPPLLLLSVPSTAGHDATVAPKEPPPLSPPRARLRRDAATVDALHRPRAREAADAVGGNREQPHRRAGAPAAATPAAADVVAARASACRRFAPGLTATSASAGRSKSIKKAIPSFFRMLSCLYAGNDQLCPLEGTQVKGLDRAGNSASGGQARHATPTIPHVLLIFRTRGLRLCVAEDVSESIESAARGGAQENRGAGGSA